MAVYPRRFSLPHYALVATSFRVYLVLGVLFDRASSSPGGDFFTGVSSQLGLAYYTVSVFLNTVLTRMTCYRIVRHGGQSGNIWDTNTRLHILLSLHSSSNLVSLGVGSPASAVFISVYLLMMVRGFACLLLVILDKLSVTYCSAYHLER